MIHSTTKLMKHRQKISPLFTALFLFVAVLVFNSCQGGTCAATDSPLDDADSDCIADGSDNCPLIYNPTQFDADTDGVGTDCDADDTDDTVADISSADSTMELSLLNQESTFLQDTPYTMPSDENPVVYEFNPDCSYYLIGCGDVFLGYLDANNPVLQKKLLNPHSVFARSFAACSALNPQASFPPAVFCLKPDSLPEFAGYLTINPQINGGQDTCDIYQSLDVESQACAEF